MKRSPLFRLAVCDHRVVIRPTNPVEHSHEAAWELAHRLAPRSGPGIRCGKCLEQRHIAKYWGTVTRQQEKREADGGVFEEAQLTAVAG